MMRTLARYRTKDPVATRASIYENFISDELFLLFDTIVATQARVYLRKFHLCLDFLI